MLYHFCKWTRKFYSANYSKGCQFYSVNFSKSYTMNLEKCYFRYIESEEKVDIAFLMKVKETVRQFNFSRKPTETLETLFARIATNVQKAINKSNKKKGSATNLEVDVKFYDSKNDPIPANLICKDLFELVGPVQLKICDHVFEAVFNAPWVVSMNLPQSILAGFPVYPEHFVTHYTEKQKSSFHWYSGKSVNDDSKEISDIHIKWQLIGKGFSYTPTAHDVGMKLKLECIPGNVYASGPAVEAVSKNVIEAGPGKCPFETRHMFTANILKDKSFRCVSYNILADLYCDSDFTRTVLHPYCPPYALHIDYRKQLIIKELVGYKADILCLQEVDKKIFNHCLLPILKEEGLEGIFYQKGKDVAEGLACFYRKERFRVIMAESIVLAKAIDNKPCFQPIWSVIKENKPLVERFLNRSTVASVTILQSNENPNEILIVGNTHLYFHPDADHIRLIQGGAVIYWLNDIRDYVISENPDKRVSIMLCGDFNSVPSCGIYQLYTTGSAPASLPDWTSNTNEAVYNLSLEQSIPLQSACGTPPFTNFTAGFADCLDYIYYEYNNLEVEQVVPFPSIEELQAHTALPSIVFPSDHIALITDLRFK